MQQFTKGYVFIAMPMIESDAMLDDVHEAIKAAAGDLGLHAERVDDPSSSERITDRVISSIRNAEYVVVDLTHGRPNVYFEAGYAHGFGKVPIYIARRDTPIEFDVKDYPVIFFRNIKELRQRLKERLQAAPHTQNAASVATVGDPQPVVRGPNLSDTGRELLSAAAQDRHGLIAVVEDRHKTYIHTNGREFAGSDEARLVALWRGAVTELLGLNFIEDRTGRGREFHVTDAGYLAAGSPTRLTPPT